MPASAWRRLSAGEGTRGPRLHDWAHLGLADLEADEYIAGFEGPWTRGLPIRRHLADGELAYFGTWRPEGIPAETLVAVEGRRRAIEDALETAKTELGLDHDGTRSRHGWHRHVSLVMLAFAVLAVARRRANVTAKQTPPRASRAGRRSSDGPSRGSAAPQPASPSAASSPRSSSPGQLGVVPVRRALNAPT